MFLQFGNFVSQLLIFLSKLTIFSSHLVWFVSDELQTEERKTRPLRSSTRDLFFSLFVTQYQYKTAEIDEMLTPGSLYSHMLINNLFQLTVKEMTGK